MYTLPIGTKITSPTTTYTITGVLGQGGFGITYSATFMGMIGSMKVKANAALKEHFVKADCVRDRDTSRVSCSDPARSRVELTRKDFIGEARRLRKISGQHPNIVTVNEVFEANNTAYYAMEMLEGESLRDYVASRGKLTERETLAIMTPIVEAVAFLHRNRITHLDIKPQNIMIATDDEGKLRPVLIDFGLSKHYDESGDATSTINSRGFSDGYAPIEQYTGITTFSPASDVYALAATMVFCLTGHRLPAALEVTPEVLEGALPTSLSPTLRSTLMRALQLQPTKRHADAGELLASLGGEDTSHEEQPAAEIVAAEIPASEVTVIDAPTPAPKSPAKPIPVKPESNTPGKPKPRKGLKIALIAAVICIIGGLAVYFISKPSTKVHEQPTAQLASTATNSEDASTSAASDQLEHVETQPSLYPAIQNLLANMVYVDGGTYSMGSNDSDAFSTEKPVHSETVGSFRIGKYEVTQKEWRAVMGSNPSEFKGDDLPVENVSWDDCQEFIRKLNSITGKNFRLPTEAEWEYAARGGRRSNGYKYSGSDNIDNVAWYGGNSGKKTHTVGTKSPNELGLHDMTGNVKEWTSDRYSDNYNSPRSSSNFVCRGGSWNGSARFCRASFRVYGGRTGRYGNLGLRLAL